MRVLIVDDTESIRYSLSFLLRLEGFECENAHDTEHALHLTAAAGARNEPFNVVILDLLMPGTPSENLVTALRSSPMHAHTKIVICSACPMIAIEAQRLCADAYLEKPFAVDSALAQIKSLANLPRDFNTSAAASIPAVQF